MDRVLADEQRVTSIVSTRPLSALLRGFGDRSQGIGGSLDIFNFLYWAIPVPSVSIAKILAARGMEISQLRSLRFEWEHPVPSGGIGEVAGAVEVSAEVVVHNPLADQLADLQATISQAIQDIEARLGANGDIMQALADAHDQALAIKKQLEDFDVLLSSASAEAEQLKAAVANVSSKIDGLS